MIARLRSTVHPVGPDTEGELGCSGVKLALCCRRSKPLPEEETKDDTPGAIELTRTKVRHEPGILPLCCRRSGPRLICGWFGSLHVYLSGFETSGDWIKK